MSCVASYVGRLPAEENNTLDIGEGADDFVLGIDPAMVLIRRVLPRVKILYCRQPDHMLGDGWGHLFRSMAKCQKLQSVTLSLPLLPLLLHDDWVASLSDFLRTKPTTMKLELTLSEDDSFEPQEEFEARGGRLLQYFAEALESNPHANPLVHELELIRFIDCPIHRDYLSRIGGSVSNLGLLHSTLKNGDIEKSDTQDKSPSCLEKLKEVVLGIALLDEMEIKASFEFDNLSTGQVQTLASLEFNCVGDVWDDFEDEVSDITVPVVAALGILSLKRLSFKTDALTSQLHGLQMRPIYQVLKISSRLETLELKGVSFCHDNVSAIPAMLLEIAEDRNTSLKAITAFDIDKKRAFTVSGNHRCYNCRYVDYPSSLKIQYSLWLNEFGRGKLRSETSTTPQLVELLIAAMKARLFTKRKVWETLKDMLPSPDQSDPLAVLNSTYTRLLGRHSLTIWCPAALGQHHAETVSILYGLLRESPGLWCFEKRGAVEVDPRFGGRKRKRKDGMMPLSFYFKPCRVDKSTE